MTKILSTSPATVNLYSDLNSQIDMIITTYNLDAESLAGLLETLLEQWFDVDSYPDLQQTPIGNYIEHSLTERHINYKIKYNIEKPECKLIGENGNIFNLIALASRCLTEHNMKEQAEEMKRRIIEKEEAHSYEEALNIIGEYVEIV